MTQYIDKAAVVAEIERRKKELIELNNGFENQWACGSLDNILSFLNTLKVKEMDLEKFTEKIKTFQGRYKHPEIVSIKGAMAFMSRMFYQYPNVARQWYEQLSKATMD